MSDAQPGVIKPEPETEGPNPPAGNPVPEHLILAAFDFVEQEALSPWRVLAALGEIVALELAPDLARPPEETGELGFVSGYDTGAMTITLGISATGFACLGVDPTDRPADLREIPWGALGDEPAVRESGHLVLQVCSDDIYVCEHVVRRVEKDLRGYLTMVWAQVGVQRFSSRQGPIPRDTSRALIGFLDGTGNLSPRTTVPDRALVLVNPDPRVVRDYPPHPESDPEDGPIYPDDLAPVPDHEPEWTRNGTYMSVRVSVFDTAKWDALGQDKQEEAVGRFKVSGASLDRRNTAAQLKTPPVYAADPKDPTVPLTAHVRKAFPYCDPRNMYRHNYSIVCSGKDHRLARGLAFVAFARTISTQFEFIFRAQMRNPHFPRRDAGVDQMLFASLSEEVICGGYYFVPAVENPAESWTWKLPYPTD